MPFIFQPFATVRLGDYLLAHLQDQQWTTFRAAIAFVKRSGTRYVRQALQQFSQQATVRMSVGIDLNGTSREGLEDLLYNLPNGQVFVFHNSGPSTFHPKIYLFKSDTRADVLVGSGNLTGGGLFVNYEAGLALSLDLNNQADGALLLSIETVLDTWSQPQQGICYLLTDVLLQQLQTSGLVRTEVQINAAVVQQQAATVATPPNQDQGAVVAVPLFITVAVPPPPPIPTVTVETLAPATPTAPQAPVAPIQVGVSTSFVMTLQRTDVGVGQTTQGTSRRSPEVFIHLAALDENPGFWNFPDQFVADTEWNADNPQYRRNGLGKLNRDDVPMRVGVVVGANMFFNPQKKDFRLRHEALRSSGNIGDIIWIQRVDPQNGFEYDVQVAPQGTPLFNELQVLYAPEQK